jgi:hypothetical protein
MGVAYMLVTGVLDISVGRLYDRAGSTWTWILILAVTLTSAALAVALKTLDKKAYPKLYKENKKEDAEKKQ